MHPPALKAPAGYESLATLGTVKAPDVLLGRLASHSFLNKAQGSVIAAKKRMKTKSFVSFFL